MVTAEHNLPRSLKRRDFGRESGYMMLILMFFVALLTFSMMASVPKLVQQMKRDHEEEMIHRGTEYARAIKKYYKKFNRYPGDLKELQNTNSVRFIRKLYKDPMTKDGTWRVLHMADVQQGISNPNFGVSQASNFNPQPGATPTGTAQVRPDAQSVNDPAADPSANLLGGDVQLGSQPSGNAGSAQPGQAVQNPGTGAQPGQTYGGGGVVGVASMSKTKSIREFNNKSNYNKWMFIYDPTQDRGGLLRGPYNPQAFVGGSNIGTGPAGTRPGATPGATQPNSQSPNGGGDLMPPDQNAPPQ